MEEISVKGEKYVKTAIIAEKFGYTSDYVGQLCRSGQVKATLVGRSWYVNEDSLRKHKKSRYRSTLSKSKESIKKLTEERSLFDQSRFMRRVASYDLDESDLIPKVTKPSTDENKTQKQKEGRDEIKIVAENIENKPLKKESLRLSEKYSQLNKPINQRPPVRIITSKTKEEARVRPHTENVNQATGLLNWFMAVFFILLSMCFFFTIVSLEKRVAITESGLEVVMYNFNITTFTEFLNKLLD